MWNNSSLHVILFAASVILNGMEKEKNSQKKVVSLFEELIVSAPDDNEAYVACMSKCWKIDHDNMKAELEKFKTDKPINPDFNDEYESCRYSCMKNAQQEIKKNLWKAWQLKQFGHLIENNNEDSQNSDCKT